MNHPNSDIHPEGTVFEQTLKIWVTEWLNYLVSSWN